jgi:hypothetical protein
MNNINHRQNDLPYLGTIILVEINNRIEPVVVCRQFENNRVLVRFINNNVMHSDINFAQIFGRNISFVENANNYIPFTLEDILLYTPNFTLQQLIRAYNNILRQIALGNLALIPNRIVPNNIPDQIIPDRIIPHPIIPHPNPYIFPYPDPIIPYPNPNPIIPYPNPRPNLQQNQDCDIDFNSIQRIDINVDLSNMVCIFTQEPFDAGTDYYQVTYRFPDGTENVSYYSIEPFEQWLRAPRNPRCRHPQWPHELTIDNIKRFTYRRTQGGEQKRRSKLSNNKRVKRSKQRK